MTEFRGIINANKDQQILLCWISRQIFGDEEMGKGVQ